MLDALLKALHAWHAPLRRLAEKTEPYVYMDKLLLLAPKVHIKRFFGAAAYISVYCFSYC